MTKKAIKLTARSLVDENDTSRQYVSLEFGLEYETDILIYRQEAKGFIFDYDSEEYFDGMMPSEGDIIFRGKPDVKNKFVYYRDYDIELEKLYVYWVATSVSGGKITGPAAVKTRDARVWWHYDKIVNEINKLENKYEGVSIIRAGETVEHRALMGVVVGNRENIIACLGGMHAGESGPEITISMLKDILETNPELLKKVGIAILPVINADMREAMAAGTPWYLRTNKNGVDINRNFDADWEQVSCNYGYSTDDRHSSTYRGPYAESEPETKATVEFVRQVNPKIILDYHALSSVTCDDMLCGKGVDDNIQFKNAFEKLARVFSDAFRKAAGMEPRQGELLKPECTAGSFPAWCLKNGFFGTDLEMALGEKLDCLWVCRDDKITPELLEYCIRLHTEAVMAVLKHLSEV